MVEMKRWLLRLQLRFDLWRALRRNRVKGKVTGTAVIDTFAGKRMSADSGVGES